MFITLEGGEGSGKTSLGGALAAELGARAPVLLTREPGGTELGERVRDVLLSLDGPALDPVSQLLLLSAARAQHVREVLLPALEGGATVLCVRYADSSRAYQGGGDGLPAETVEVAIRLATGGLEPDLTLYLDVPPGVGLQRRGRARGEGAEGAREGWNRFDARELEFHERVRAEYLRLARRYPRRIVILDAARPLEAVRDQALQVVSERLAARAAGGGA